MDEVKYDVIVTISVTRVGSRHPAKSVTLVTHGLDAEDAAGVESVLSIRALETMEPYQS